MQGQVSPQGQGYPQTGQGYPQTGQGYPQTGQGYPPVLQVPPPTIVIAQPPRNIVQAYNCQLAVKLGVCQIVLGILVIVFNIAAYVVHSSTTNVIFYGVSFILAGAFEVTSGKTNTRCWIITTMVFGILAAIFAASATITPAISLGLNRVDGLFSDQPEWYFHARYAINGFLLAIAITEFVIAIIASVLTCKGICCTSQPIGQQQGVVISPTQYYTGQPVPANQVVYPGQQAMAPPGYTYQTADHAPPAYQATDIAPPAPQPYAPGHTEDSSKTALP